MKFIRKLLFPFSLIYGIVTGLRNYLYDNGYLKSVNFNIPIIAVGNLSVGGTGKTPMVEYLIRLLSDQYSLAILSRGYKRKTTGFILASSSTMMEDIGDEPFQYHSKFRNVSVAVDANRVEGVEELLKGNSFLDAVILDDAFQHRKIKAGFYIMLTAYSDLFYNDLLLPAGNLRENKTGVARADLVVVTKCPEDLSIKEQEKIMQRIDKSQDKVFFSMIDYSGYVTNGSNRIETNELTTIDFIALTGIAKPQFFYDYLNCTQEKILTFPDHHHFSKKDIHNILDFANGRKIITTEKDYMRLQNIIPKKQLFYLPIQMKMLTRKADFENKINEYIKRDI